MARDAILSTDRVADALKVKINDDMTELFDAILALAAGSGVVISAADIAMGFLVNKLLGSSGIRFDIGVPGGDETLIADTELTKTLLFGGM